jgi:LEA14-like dessication related protein
MVRRSLYAALLVPLLVAGCAEVGKIAASAIERPKLTFKAVRLRSLDLAAATLAFDFEIENPNSFGLELARAQYMIEVERTRVTAGDVPGGLSLPARKKAPFTVDTQLRFSDVPGIASLLGKRESIRYRISGSVGVRTALGIIELPFAHEAELPLPRPPAFRLERLHVRSISLDRLSLEVQVRIANGNAFPLPAGQLRTSLSLAGVDVAQVESGRISPVPANGDALVSIPLDVKLGEVGRAGADLLRGAPVEVGLRGAARIGGAELPISLSARLPTR